MIAISDKIKCLLIVYLYLFYSSVLITTFALSGNITFKEAFSDTMRLNRPSRAIAIDCF